MAPNYHPSEGVRLLLERQDHSSVIVYRGSVFTPNERFDYDIRLDDDGKIILESEHPADSDDEKKLKKLADSVARKAKKDDGSWPDRVLRWRGPGRG